MILLQRDAPRREGLRRLSVVKFHSALQTSTIHYRVADFLKRFPPFTYLDDSALERLTARGRVLFRERDDLIFDEGSKRGRFIYVIRQGGARLSQKRAGAEALIDLRGEGDILGLGGYLGLAAFEFTARALEDSLLYALDLEAFTRECSRNPQAARFLAIYFASSQADPGSECDSGGATNWYREAGILLDRYRSHLLTCLPDRKVRDAAREMGRVDRRAMLVTDSLGRPAGIFTEIDLRDRVATGEVSVDAPVSQLMQSPVATVPPGTSVGESLLRMMRGGFRHLCVTEDGTPNSRAVGVVSERDLMLFYGNNPMVIVRAIRCTTNLDALASLRNRADALVRAGLRSFSDVDWYCELVAEVNRALFRRVVELAVGEASGAGLLGADSCFALIGSAGRREMLSRTDLASVLILGKHRAGKSEDYRRLARSVQTGLRACGFADAPFPVAAGDPAWYGTVEEWQENFERWVTKPIESGIHKRLAYFDLDPLDDGHLIGERIRDTVRSVLARTPGFVALLANDSLAHLPPLTIFEGYAVDAQGLPLDGLDIKMQAIRPVTDVARVLTLEAGDLHAHSTLARLERASKRIPEASEVLTLAARAFRIALFHRAIHGFRTGGDGSRLPPATLTRTEQALLKSSFPAIARLLDFLAKRYGFSR